MAGYLVIHGAMVGPKSLPPLALLIGIVEATRDTAQESGVEEPISIGELAALYTVQAAASQPLAPVLIPIQAAGEMKGDYDSLSNADSAEGKIKAGLDFLEKGGGLVALAVGGAKGVRGMVEVGGEGPGAAGGGQRFFRGAKPGQTPNFTPRPNEFKVNPATGTVTPTHGVSVFDNPVSVSSKGFVPHEIDQATVPTTLQIKQRGVDPAHYEIMPAEDARLTPGQFTTACQGIRCKQ